MRLIIGSKRWKEMSLPERILIVLVFPFLALFIIFIVLFLILPFTIILWILLIIGIFIPGIDNGLD